MLYEYQPGRGAEHPKAFLSGYKGYLQTDGYAGYHDLGENVTLVGIWAHACRKFDEAMKSLPKGKTKGSSAYQGLAFCDMLFAIENGLAGKNATTEDRYKERLEHAKPVFRCDVCLGEYQSRRTVVRSGKVLTYLTNYLKDGRMELSNNQAERSVKPFVIDRKNFRFDNTPTKF